MSDLVAAWRDLAGRHAVLHDALEHELQKRHGLSLSEFEVLTRLADASDGRRIQELADEVHISQSALSRLVSRLEDSGLTCRNACSDDRRGVYACITAAGMDRVQAARPTQDEVLGRLLA
jgi:DNA-binding MarR family transcriptional regulator